MRGGLRMVAVTPHDAVLEKNPRDELGARICDVRAVDFRRFHDRKRGEASACLG